MQKLPIHDILPQIQTTAQTHSTFILEAPPGAGKSTIVPLAFLEAPWLNDSEDKMIIMLEPRRVAARMVASQMAKLLGESVGQRVGYQIRMDSCQSKETKILIVTEAILVRMLQSDQSLENVAMVIFDEFHERSIHTDLSLALSLEVQELLREDLKILIMSATLNSTSLLELLGDVPVLTSQGKVYEVENIYLPKNIKQPDFKTLNTLLGDTVLKAVKEDEGDILVFLSGVKEIAALQTLLNKKIKNENIEILPLYSALSKKEQDRAIRYDATSSKRKIILSTNIAQTSLTIEGVKVVIDSGMEKLSRYNYSNGMNHLELSFISQDSAVQRGGRAGRLSNGKCYKLWHQDKILAPSTKAEVLRSDLSAILLDLALWGVEDIHELKWLDIPEQSIIQESKEVLQELQMLDENFKITDFGKEAIALGIHPRFAFMILKANELGLSYEACLLSSMLTLKDIYKPKAGENNDLKERFEHLFYNDIEHHYINRHRALEVYKQAEFFYSKLKKIKKVLPKNQTLNSEMLPVLLLFAYPDRLAKQRGKDNLRYKLSNGKGATLNNTANTLFNERFLVVADLHAHNKDSFIYLALNISLESIREYFSSYFVSSTTTHYIKSKEKFERKESTYFFKLELFSTTSSDIPKEEYQALLLEQIKKEQLDLLPWSKKAKNLQDKINFINDQDIDNLDTGFVDLSDTWLMENLENWLSPYLSDVTSIAQLTDLDLYTLLSGLIPWDQMQLLDQLLPKSIIVPSGSSIAIDYTDMTKPKISVKIQEVFGMHTTPKIMNNTIPLQIHLLSPAMRPIQITYDLKSFWESGYEEVRKELRGKYKKHYWPENPYEAVATNKTKKNMERA